MTAEEVIGVRRGMFGISGSGDTSGYGRLVREISLPGSSPRPYGGYFDDVIDRLGEVLGADGFDRRRRTRRRALRPTDRRGPPRTSARGRASTTR